MTYKLERLFFTVCVIVIYRFATYISLPGLDLSAMGRFYSENSTILGIFNSMSGGAVSRMSIMALHLVPYMTASIIIQLLTSVIPEWKELKKDSYQRKKITRYSRLIALAIAFVQSLAVAIGLENIPGLVIDPGFCFKFTSVVSIVSGSIFAVWLSERIGERGIGNGSSVMIFTSILASSVPNVLVVLKNYLNSPMPNYAFLSLIASGLVGFVLIIVFCEMLKYSVNIYFKRPALVTFNAVELSSNSVPIKINPVGILPAIFAESVLTAPILIFKIIESRFNLSIPPSASMYINLFLKALLILFFCIFCLSFVMNSEEVADNLRSRNAYIDKVPEGSATARYFERLLNQISIIGCVYMLFVTIGPDLISIIYFGSKGAMLVSGTSLLITISSALEIYERLAPEPSVNVRINDQKVSRTR